MRCLAALQTCLAVLLAFLVAPFQHVHTGEDHDHSTVVHAHFYRVPAAHAERNQAGITDADDDDHAAARSLDTFTLVLTAGLSPFIPSLGPAILFVPHETFEPVEIVEECGHDPPCVDCSIPRAPPV